MMGSSARAYSSSLQWDKDRSQVNMLVECGKIKEQITEQVKRDK